MFITFWKENIYCLWIVTKLPSFREYLYIIVVIFVSPQYCSPLCERVWLISLEAMNSHTRRHSAPNGFYERNAMHTSQLMCDLSYLLAETSHMPSRVSWDACGHPAPLVQYTSDLLKQFVQSMHRIFSLAASCNTSFWDVFGPVYPFYLRRTTTRSLPTGGSWWSLWACVSNSRMTNHDSHSAFCELMATEPMSHTHTKHLFAVRKKVRTQWNFGGFCRGWCK